MQILVIGHSKMIIGMMVAFFPIFGPQKMQILVIGHPQMILGAFGTQKMCLQMFADLGIFDPKNMQIW